MNITVSLSGDLVRQARRIAAERGATQAAPIHSHLEAIVGEHENLPISSAN